MTVPDQLLSEAGLSEADTETENRLSALRRPQADDAAGHAFGAGISRTEFESALLERHLPAGPN